MVAVKEMLKPSLAQRRIVITGIGPLTTLEQRLLLDLRDYSVHPG